MEKAATTVFSLALVFMNFLIALGGGEANYTRSDESALLAFKSHITYDPNHILATNWSTNTSFCHWLGVSCRHRGQNRVTSLDLSNMGLKGTIPPQIGNLSFLTYFDISSNYFNGHLPAELGQLRRLKEFDFDSNEFSGEFLTSIFNVSSIQIINFRNNSLSGSLPDDVCSHLPKLRVLLLSYNEFSGDVPLHWGGCRKLQILTLYGNNFTGFIPRGIGNLTLLRKLYLGSNNLQGVIPPEMGNLHSLELLSLITNNLASSIPSSLFNITSLQVLYLFNNQLFGSLPMDICSSDGHGLEILSLESNQLTGSIPQCIGNYTSLKVLDLHENKLSGFQQQSTAIPWSFLLWFDISSNKLQGLLPVPPPSMVLYKAHDNALTGPIPPSICHNNSLYSLDLSNNNLNGTIPPCLASHSKDLLVLNLSGNSFHGNIPSFTMNSQLVMIDLARNQLQGPVPRSLANCIMLERLILQNNQIEDIFPSWLGALPKLELLILRSNKFHGHIGNPKNNSLFPKLRIIDLSYNGFSGNLPIKYIHNWNGMKIIKKENLTYDAVLYQNEASAFPTAYYREQFMTTVSEYSMQVVIKGIQRLYQRIPSALAIVDISSNTFVGDIPVSFGSLSGLKSLNISNNRLTGAIPPSLAKLTELESLDLSQNLLSGQIPRQLTELTFLSILNVSHNRLTGPIPQGKQFDTFENSSYNGNSGLCGVPLSKLCGNSMTTPQPPSIFQGHGLEFSRGVYWMVIALGYGSGLVVGLVIGITLTRRYHYWFVETFGRGQKLKKQQKRKCRRT